MDAQFSLRAAAGRRHRLFHGAYQPTPDAATVHWPTRDGRLHSACGDYDTKFWRKLQKGRGVDVSFVLDELTAPHAKWRGANSSTGPASPWAATPLAAPALSRHWFTVKGMVHPSFTDTGLLGEQLGLDFGAKTPATGGKAIIRAYVRAFFDLHLRGKPSPLLKQESPDYPEVEIVR